MEVVLHICGFSTRYVGLQTVNVEAWENEQKVKVIPELSGIILRSSKSSSIPDPGKALQGTYDNFIWSIRLIKVAVREVKGLATVSGSNQK